MHAALAAFAGYRGRNCIVAAALAGLPCQRRSVNGKLISVGGPNESCAQCSSQSPEGLAGGEARPLAEIAESESYLILNEPPSKPKMLVARLKTRRPRRHCPGQCVISPLGSGTVPPASAKKTRPARSTWSSVISPPLASAGVQTGEAVAGGLGIDEIDIARKGRQATAAHSSPSPATIRARSLWLYDPANKEQVVDILVKHAHQKPSRKAYEYLIQKLKLLATDAHVSDAAYAKMVNGLAAIGTATAPFPPKSAIFDASFVRAAN